MFDRPMLALNQSYPLTIFARYHNSDYRAVMDAILKEGMGEHFFIECPGKREDGTIAEGSFTIYTDLIRPDASGCAKQYENLTLRTELGLIISVKA